MAHLKIYQVVRVVLTKFSQSSLIKRQVVNLLKSRTSLESYSSKYYSIVVIYDLGGFIRLTTGKSFKLRSFSTQSAEIHT